MDLPKLSIQPILDARADRMDPTWEAAMGSRQHLKHSYAMDARMPGQPNYPVFTTELFGRWVIHTDLCWCLYIETA